MRAFAPVFLFQILNLKILKENNSVEIGIAALFFLKARKLAGLFFLKQNSFNPAPTKQILVLNIFRKNHGVEYARIRVFFSDGPIKTRNLVYFANIPRATNLNSPSIVA